MYLIFFLRTFFRDKRLASRSGNFTFFFSVVLPLWQDFNANLVFQLEDKYKCHWHKASFLRKLCFGGGKDGCHFFLMRNYDLRYMNQLPRIWSVRWILHMALQDEMKP